MEKRFHKHTGEEIRRLFYSKKQQSLLEIGYDERNPGADWNWVYSDVQSKVLDFMEWPGNDAIYKMNIWQAEAFYFKYAADNFGWNPFEQTKTTRTGPEVSAFNRRENQRIKDWSDRLDRFMGQREVRKIAMQNPINLN